MSTMYDEKESFPEQRLIVFEVSIEITFVTKM